ncbi:phosphotransferase [Phenylobacterium sp.]|uniref:phosphotransferase family protein n=1 Tax=Phenylobacterium sp. TaxID=1871053 RepID=UPI0030F468DE
MKDAPVDLNRDPAGWAAALLTRHGLKGGPLQPMAGWSNEIWASETYVVRIASGRFEGSLSHEAGVLRALRDLPCPRVVATGQMEDREWMIQTRLPGANLMQLWPGLDVVERERAVRSLAETLRGLHATPLSPDLREPPWRAASLEPGGDPSRALRVQPAHYRRLIDANLERNTAPAALLEMTSDFIAARLGGFATSDDVLTHGDLSFANVIWDGDRAALVDFESAGAAPPDRELDVLLRFLEAPEVFSPGSAEGSAALYAPVAGWLRDAYPELFACPHLAERLEVYDALWELVQLMNYPADHPRDTAGRLEAIVTGRARRL